MYLTKLDYQIISSSLKGTSLKIIQKRNNISKNGTVRYNQSLSLHKSNKKTVKNCQNSELWVLIKSLQHKRDHLIKQKKIKLIKPSSISVETALHSMPPSSAVALKSSHSQDK